MRSSFKASHTLVLLLAAAACDRPTPPAAQTAAVEMTIADAAEARAAHVQATDHDSGMLLDRVFVIGPDMAINFGLPPGTYLVRLELFADEARAQLLGAGSESIEVRAGLTNHVRARLDLQERDADGVAKVQLVANQPPVIERVDVTFSAPPVAGELGGRNALIHVTASDADNDPAWA
jgi:hypothetical protein